MKMLLRFLVAVSLVLLFLLPLCALGEQADVRFESEGTATPEAAVTVYIDAMRAQDLDGMVSAFAIEHVAEHQNLADRIHVNQFWDMQMGLAQDSPMGSRFAVYQRLSEVYREVMKEFWILTNGSEGSFQANITMFKATEDDYQALMGILSTASTQRLATLSQPVFYTELPAGFTPGQDRTREMTRTNWDAWYGADDYAELMGEINMNGERYLMTAVAGQYDDGWHLLGFSTTDGLMNKKQAYSGLLWPYPMK